MIGFEAALLAGARHLELDVQFTADAVPVLYHDVGTQRMSGVTGRLLERSRAQVASLEASFPARFGERFRGNPIVSLADFCAWIVSRPGWDTVFVEAKRASLRHFGREAVIDAIIDVMAPIRERAVIISFDYSAVDYARTAHGVPIGWVLPIWSGRHLALAGTLAPEFLFCSEEILPQDATEIHRGPWAWVVYVIDDPEMALEVYRRGVGFVETDCIVEMLRHPLLAERARCG